MTAAAADRSSDPISRIPSDPERMFPCMLTPREQGDIGELSAIVWLAAKGFPVFKPIFHSPRVGPGRRPRRRTCRGRSKDLDPVPKWPLDVSVCTRGGNRSWSGMVKRLDPSRYDFLFVLTGDGRRWFIPSDQVEGGSGPLGGPKYAEFEVEPGRPDPNRTAADAASTIAS